MASNKAATEGDAARMRPTPAQPPGRDAADATTTGAAAKTSASPEPSSPVETPTDLSSPHSVRQKEKVSEAMSPSSPAENKKALEPEPAIMRWPPRWPRKRSAVAVSTSPGKPTDRTPSATVLTTLAATVLKVSPPQVSQPPVKKADTRASDRGGQKVSKIPVMWSPEKVKGAALGLLSKRPSSQTPDSDLSSKKTSSQTPDSDLSSKRTSSQTPDCDLSSSAQKENISEEASSAAPPSKKAKLYSDAAVAALSAAMDLLAKTPPAPPLASSPDTKHRPLRTGKYARKIQRLKQDADEAPAIMRRYRALKDAKSASSAAAMRLKNWTPEPAIMRRKHYHPNIKKEGHSPVPIPKSLQKAYKRRADARKQRITIGFKTPPPPAPFKVTGAVFCEGRVMGLLATRPVAGTSADVKQRAALTSAPPAQKAAGDQRDKSKRASTAGPSTRTSDPDATPAIMRRKTYGGGKAKTPPGGPSSSSSSVKQAEGTESFTAQGAAAVNLSSKTAAPSSSSPGQQAEQKADRRPVDRAGQTAIPVTWSAESVKGATMGLLAKTSDPSSSTQSIQKAEERPVDIGSKVPVTVDWSPEKVKGVMSLLAKRSGPSSSSDTTEVDEDALSVMRLRQRIRPPRKVVKKGPLQMIAHHIKLGHYHKLPGDIMAIPGLYDLCANEVMKRVKEECARVTLASFGSVLRHTSLQALKDFQWEDLVQEWRTSAPTFLKFLQSAASVSLDGTKAKKSPTGAKAADTSEAKTKKRVAAMAGALVLHARSRHMRAPMVRNSLLLHAGDKKRCFQRFRTQGLCVSYKQTLTKVKEMGETYDKEVLLWKEDAIAGGKRGAAAAADGESATTAENSECQQDPQDGGQDMASSSAGQSENGMVP